MLVSAEKVLVLVLLFTSLLRKLMIKILDKIKQGKGPVVSKTVRPKQLEMSRKEAAEEMKPKPDLKLDDHEKYPKKPISST
ncbi:hypothetical protein V6N13_049604 [Hibiscus sabdariffa]